MMFDPIEVPGWLSQHSWMHIEKQSAKTQSLVLYFWFFFLPRRLPRCYAPSLTSKNNWFLSGQSLRFWWWEINQLFVATTLISWVIPYYGTLIEWSCTQTVENLACIYNWTTTTSKPTADQDAPHAINFKDRQLVPGRSLHNTNSPDECFGKTLLHTQWWVCNKWKSVWWHEEINHVISWSCAIRTIYDQLQLSWWSTENTEVFRNYHTILQ